MKNTFRVRRISATVLGIDQKYLALGLAFAICLLLVAGMKATSAVGPTQSPPSGNVTPNFTSITVNNTSTFKAGLDLQGPLKNTLGAETPVSIEDNLQVDGNSELKGNVNVTGDIKSKKIYNPESLPVRTYNFTSASSGGGICKWDVKWSATVMHTQNVTDSGSDGSEKVSATVDGDLVVAVISFPSCGVSPASQTVDRSNLNIADSSLLTGDLSIGGNLVVAGKVIGLQIPAQSNVFDTLTVNTSLDLKGDLKDSTGKVTVNDADGMEFSTVKDVSSSGTAMLRFGTGASWLGIDNNEIAAYGDKLSLQESGATTDVKIGTNLEVANHIKTGTIGTWIFETATINMKTQLKGLTTLPVTCPATTTMVSCNPYFWNSFAGGWVKGVYYNASDTVNVLGAKIDNENNTCTGLVRKDSVGSLASDADFKVQALCFDPNT